MTLRTVTDFNANGTSLSRTVGNLNGQRYFSQSYNDGNITRTYENCNGIGRMYATRNNDGIFDNGLFNNNCGLNNGIFDNGYGLNPLDDGLGYGFDDQLGGGMFGNVFSGGMFGGGLGGGLFGGGFGFGGMLGKFGQLGAFFGGFIDTIKGLFGGNNNC